MILRSSTRTPDLRAISPVRCVLELPCAAKDRLARQRAAADAAAAQATAKRDELGAELTTLQADQAEKESAKARMLAWKAELKTNPDAPPPTDAGGMGVIQ